MDNNGASHGLTQWHGTTIIGVKKGGKTVIAGDGQVSMGNTVMKPNARKVRRLGEGGVDKGNVIAGFAGATADAFTLFDRLERKLEQYRGQLMRAAVELANLPDMVRGYEDIKLARVIEYRSALANALTAFNA